VIGDALLGRAGEHYPLAVDHVVDAEEGMVVEKPLPALGVARRTGERQLPARAERAADGVDDDASMVSRRGPDVVAPAGLRRASDMALAINMRCYRLRTPVRRRRTRGSPFWPPMLTPKS
jgi:hypothetical protein